MRNQENVPIVFIYTHNLAIEHTHSYKRTHNCNCCTIKRRREEKKKNRKCYAKTVKFHDSNQNKMSEKQCVDFHRRNNFQCSISWIYEMNVWSFGNRHWIIRIRPQFAVKFHAFETNSTVCFSTTPWFFFLVTRKIYRYIHIKIYAYLLFLSFYFIRTLNNHK